MLPLDELLVNLHDRIVRRVREREDPLADLAHDDGERVSEDRIGHSRRLAHWSSTRRKLGNEVEVEVLEIRRRLGIARAVRDEAGPTDEEGLRPVMMIYG